MKTDNLRFAITAAITIGIAQTLLLFYCWAYIGAYTPVSHWLLSLGIRGTLYFTLLFVIDSITSIVLCLPAAFALSQLRPRKLLIYLVAAVIPGFLWEYSHLLQDPSVFLAHWPQFIPSIISNLLVLPAAVAVLLWVRKPSHA